MYGGVISGYEHNSDLSDPAKMAETVERMLRTATALATGWFVFRSLMLSAVAHAEPPKDASREPADLVNENLGLDGQTGHLVRSWEDVLSSLLHSAIHGWGVYECLWRVLPDERQTWLTDLEDREQWTHYRWLHDAEGNLSGWEQTSDPDSGRYSPRIMASNFLLLTWNQTGRNYHGRGLFRPAYGAWKDFIDCMRHLAALQQRYAVPALDVEVSWEAAQRLPEDEKSKKLGGRLKQELDALAAQVGKLTSHEQGYLSHYDIFKITALANGTFDPAPLLAAARYHNHEMLRGLLGQWLDLGATETGSRAVAEVLGDVPRDVGVHILRQIGARLSGPPRPGAGILGRLVRYNTPSVPDWELPVLRFEGLQIPEWLRHLETLPSLSAWLTPTDDDEDRVRAALDLPSRGEDVERPPMERLGSGQAAPAESSFSRARPSAGDAAMSRLQRRRQQQEGEQ